LGRLTQLLIVTVVVAAAQVLLGKMQLRPLLALVA
jgi:hypothetical protein